MRNLRGVRLSPALAISVVALVLAAGGTSLASGPAAFVAKALGLNGKQKKQVKAIADSEITSKSAKLSVLFANSAGKATTAGSAATATTATSATSATNAISATNAVNAVNANHASSADSATSAGDAATVGGMTVKKVVLSEPVPGSGTTTTTLFSLDGLTIKHGCVSVTQNQTLSASTTQVGILKLLTTDDSGEKPFGFERFNFTPGEGEVNMYAGIPDSENVGGRLVWQTESGKVLTFVFQDETNAFGATNCVIAGTVIAS